MRSRVVVHAVGPDAMAALVLFIGAIDTGLWVVWVVIFGGQLFSGEALSRSLAGAVITVATVPWLALNVPGLVLALRRRLLPVALVLVLAAPVLALLALRNL